MSLVAENFTSHPALRPFVDHYWSYTFAGPQQDWSPWQKCLPGAKLELIVHVDSGRHMVSYQDQTTLMPEAQIVGIHTDPVRWQIPGQSLVFGVQLTLEGFIRIFHRPPGDIGGLYVDMRDFCTPAELEIVDIIKTAASHAQRVEALDRFFLDRISEPRPGERYLLEAIRALEHHAGQYSIEALSGEVFIGARQLQRTFREYVGTTPKVYSRILRFRTAYDYLAEHPRTSWAEISYRFGYADQSHFIRDFKQFTGTAPTTFVASFRRPFAAANFAIAAA